MSNKMKKLLAFLLSAVLVLGSLPLSAMAAAKAPSKPTGITAASAADSITIKWKKVSGAKGYEVYSYNTSTKKSKKLSTTTKTSYKHSRLSSGKSYCYYIKAYNLNSKKKKQYSKASAKLYTSTNPAKPGSLKVASKTYSSVKITWSKVSGATSYYVQCSTSSSFKSGVTSATVTSNSKAFSSLKPSTKYYFRVRAVKSYKKKSYNSALSSVISTTTSAKPSAPSTPSRPSTPETPSTPSTPVNPYPDDNTAFSTSRLDALTRYQSIDGFGASACWWAKKVGTWSTDEIDDVIRLLYSKQDGIGLNIYRYNLGAGSSKNPWNNDFGDSSNVNARGEGDASFDVGKSAESFVESYNGKAFTYNWNNDKAAQNCLYSARSFCPDLRVTLFCNSPPVELTENGRGAGHWTIRHNEKGEEWGEATQNITYSNFRPFADYVIACGNHFVDEGYRVTDVSPVNEPQFNWCTSEHEADGVTPGWIAQEGCHYNVNKSDDDLKYLYWDMVEAQRANERKNSKYDYKISMLESGAAEGANTVFSAYLDSIWTVSDLREYFDSVSVHSYWSSTETKRASAAYISTIKNGITNKPISVKATEYCQMYEDENTGIFEMLRDIAPTNAEGIEAGVAMAKVIHDDLTILSATEWDWWTACSNGIYPDGLVYINNNNHSDITTTKRLWCLGNYSKFISEGARRIKISETNSAVNSSAYLNPDGSIAVVYVNPSSTDLQPTIKLGSANEYSIYTTSTEHSLGLTSSGTASSIRVSLPSQSVVTVLLK